MEGIGLGVVDVIHLALVNGALAGAIDEGAVLLVLADDGALVGEQALMADEYPLFLALDEEDMTGIRFRELDGGSNRGLQNVIHGGSDLDQDLLHVIPPSYRSAIMAPFHGVGARSDHCRIDEESRLYLRRSQGV